MRVRLPPSVISTIESHLKPGHIPVATLPGSKKGRPRINGRPTWTRDDVQLNNQLSIGPDAALPYVPHLLRTSPLNQSHEMTAHAYLYNDRLDRSSPSSILGRQSTYSRLISTFLDHPQGLTAIRSLLIRSMEEGVPISVPTLTSILKSVLMSSDINERVQVIYTVLPLLPEKLDIPLLDVLLRTIIRDTNPGPEVVEKMITDCMRLEDQLVESRKDWPLEVWDLLVLAHSQRSDLRGAITLLAEFKGVVESRRQALPSSSTSAPTLNKEDKRAICKVFTTVLNAYHRQARSDTGRNRKQVLIPRRLAKDLVELLGDERPSIMFLNAWLRAERAMGEMGVVASIWELINRGQKLDLAELEDGPDSDSWTQFFALYHTSPSASDSSATPLPPLRRSLRRFFDQSVGLSTTLLTTPLASSMLRAIFYPSPGSIPPNSSEADDTGPPGTLFERVDSVDLPSALVVLREMRRNDIQADRKTVDLLSSGMMNIIFSFPQAEQREFFSIFRIDTSSFRYREQKARERGGRTWKRMGLGVQDWDIVSEMVHYIRRRTSRSDEVLEMVYLPLSMPIGRLSSASPLLAPRRGQGHTDTPADTIVSNQGSESAREKPNLATTILSPLTILTEQLVVFLARRSRAGVDAEGESEKQDMLNADADDHILRAVMRQVEREIVPPRRRKAKLSRVVP